MNISQVTLYDIFYFLSENNISLMLNGATVSLHKIKNWFNEYYENENSAFFDSWVLNLFGDFSFINTLMFPHIEDIKDKTKWNDTLLNECVNFLQSQLNGVALVHDYEITKLLATTKMQYEPLENYRMVESGTDIVNGSASTSGSDVTTNNMEVTENVGNTHSIDMKSKTVPSKTSDRDLKNSPYDTSSYFNKEHETVTETVNGEETETNDITTDSVTNTSQTDVTTSNDFDNNTTNEVSTTHEFTRSGNIGVTTSQQMLQSEREVAIFSIFQHFWELFVRDNMILLDECSDWNDCIFG